MDRERLRAAWDRAAKDVTPRELARIVHGDVPTFMQLPRAKTAEDLKGANVAFLGVPYEGYRPYSPQIILPPEAADAPADSIYFRTGVDKAPEWVRRWSVQHSILHSGAKGYFVEHDIQLTDYLRMVDFGDAECVRGETMLSLGRARDKILEVLRAGAIPLIMGGDHSVPIPAFMALSACTREKIGVIAFDSHFDLLGMEESWGAEKQEEWNAASQYVRALELPNFEPENIVLIGMKGIHNPREWADFARELGIRYFTMKEIDERTIEHVVAEAIERATTRTRYLYVTLDIDVVDCAICPGQRYPDTPGLSPREIIRALRAIGASEVISGFDIACLSPQYDPAGATPFLAARCFLEVMASLAVHFRDKALDKWFVR